MSVRIASLGLALLATACVHPYEAPTPSQPHATIKIRRTFETSAGTQLRETALVSGHSAENTSVAVAEATGPRASAILVHPRPASFAIGGGFSHWETQMVTENYSEQVPYTTIESYSCGFGTNPQTCTRTLTMYRLVPRTRTVPRSVEVSDGRCARALDLAPKVDHMYILDFTYRQNGVCSLSCLEQTAIVSDGTFQTGPCPALTAEDRRSSPWSSRFGRDRCISPHGTP